MTWFSRFLSRWRSWLPELILGILCLSLAIFSVQRPFTSDDYEYEVLARSLQRRQYSLDGIHPTMQREPGYPALKAIVYSLGGATQMILVLQALLVVLTAYFWRRSWRLVSPEHGWIGDWGVVLAYGYWLFVPKALYEVVLGFYLAVSFFALLRFWTRPTYQKLIGAGLGFGLLILTRGIYLFLWMPAFWLGWWLVREVTLSKKQLIRFFACFTIACVLLPGAWMVRNGRTFGSYSLADRPGLVLLCRAALLSFPVPSYVASLGSVLIGEQAVTSLIPSAEPVVDQHWTEAERIRFALSDNGAALTHDVDQDLLKEAKRRIFASPKSVLYSIAWTPVELAHLFGLPSPNYPHTTLETMFRGQPLPLPIAKLVVIIIIHLGQLMYWGLLLYGIYFAIRQERKVVFLSLPVLYLVVIHAPLDNVVRFAAPTQPVQMAFVLYGAVQLFKKVYPALLKGFVK